MSIQIGDITLTKVFIEARHEKNIDISDNVKMLQTLYKMCKDDFVQQNLDLDNGVFLMTNPLKKISATIDSNRIIVDYDEPSTQGNFRNTFIDVIKNASSNLNIEKFSRLGLRSIWGYKLPNIEEANNLIYKKFFGLSESFLGAFGTDVDNYHCGFNVKAGAYKINYNFAPITFQNIIIENNVPRVENQRHLAVIDIDFYIDSVFSSKDINVFVKDGANESEKRVNAYINVIKGE